MRFCLALLAASMLLFAGCGSKSTVDSNATGGGTAGQPPKAGEPPMFADKAPLDKLLIKDSKVGTGDKANTGDFVWVLYTGKLKDGTVFDSNEVEGKEILTFPVGRGQVIKGWNQGIVGMKVGGERELGVPASLAYGPDSPGPAIPPNSDLFFHIKLLYALSPDRTMTFDYQDIKIGSGPEIKNGSKVSVKYTGKLLNGQIFDSTEKSGGNPYTFTVGKGEVIAGWEKGLLGVRQGGKRRLVLPPSLGYGGQQKPGLPPNSVLDFEIEVVEVK